MAEGKRGGQLRSSVFDLCSALIPNFDSFSAERATTQTLKLLTAAMLGYTAVIVAWAIGAGAMRTAWLYTIVSKGAPAANPWAVTFNLSFIFLLLLQVLRAIGGALAIGMAAGLVGTIVGFIFGIPSQGGSGAAPAPAATGGAAPAHPAQPAGTGAWRLSSNLAQISTWLTSAIIGVSLVEAKNALGTVLDLAKGAAGWLFESRHGSPAVLAAVIIGSAVFGFLYAYLYAELIVSRMIIAVDRGLQGLETATDTLKNMAAITEALAPRISRSARTPEVSDTLSPAEVEAALRYIGISFADISRPGVAPDTIRSWARAKAVLNDYRSAAQGYVLLLGMK